MIHLCTVVTKTSSWTFIVFGELSVPDSESLIRLLILATKQITVCRSTTSKEMSPAKVSGRVDKRIQATANVLGQRLVLVYYPEIGEEKN